jgi:hypothetical protein
MSATKIKGRQIELDTDGTLSANSDSVIASQKALKTYIDGHAGSGGSIPIAAAGGTANAITADFSPDITLTDKVVCMVVAGAANTSTAPTFAPDGLTAHTITARGGAALKVADIPGANFVMILEYNSANTRWELLNPSVAKIQQSTGNPSGYSIGDIYYDPGDGLFHGSNDIAGGDDFIVTLALGDGRYAVKFSPTFTGDPKAPTATKGDNDTSIATTAFVKNALTPTVPAVRSVSAEATGTGNVTPTLPSGHVTNDILLLIVQSANESISAPAGYTQIGPQNGVGTAAASGSTRLAVFWKRDGGSESNPTITDAGNRTYATMLAISGCVTTGNPFHFKNNGFKKTASTSMSIPGGETTIDNMLLLAFVAHAVSSASAQYSSIANSDLSSVSEQFDDASTDGVGGGLGVFSGVKATAGVFGTFTATLANSSAESFMCIAMIPSEKFQAGSSQQPTEVYNYITGGSTDLINIPTNAKAIEIVAIGGGGAGGQGILSTAAGGGGGGGGAYSRKTFKVLELTLPLQIITGKGGVGGSTKSAATESKVINNNGSGNTLVNAGFGVIGVAATSNTGGSGSPGGSVGSLAAAASNAQGNGGQGGGLSSGGGTGAVGSKGDQGGGAGGGGKNAAGTGTGGTSEYGGGGGGGGGSTGNGGAGGVGGSGQAGGGNTGGNATEISFYTLGGSGGGGTGTGNGGNGAQPGGGGGGGGPTTNNGGNGGDGSVVVIVYY